MKYSPLQLDGLYFTEVRIASVPFAKEEDVSGIDVSVETEASPNTPTQSKQWCVIVKVKLNPKEGVVAPYHGEVEALGSFTVLDPWPENQVENLVYINGSGLVYAAIREMICSITSRGFFSMFMLPSCSFGQMFKDKEASAKAEADKQAAELKVKEQSQPAAIPSSESAPSV